MKPLIFLLLLFTSAYSFAQIKRHVVPVDKTMFEQDSASIQPSVSEVQKKNKEIFRNLNLTKEQYGKLKEIKQTAKSKKEAILDNDKLSDQEKKLQMKAIRKDTEASVKAVLTDEEWQKYQQLKKSELPAQKEMNQASADIAQ